MQDAQGRLLCPHCGAELQALRLPEEAGWGERRHWVCFEDRCPYFVEGWAWMWEKYEVKASYRFRVVDAATGRASPLPVWSKSALRDRIIEIED